MLKNLKSKFLLGVMVIAIMFVGAFALTQKASAAPQAIVTVADIQYAATVKSGSSGQAALIWQNFLNGYSITANLVADGKFGPLSEVQAKAWQASRGLSADGVLGAMSRASAIAQITSGIPASTFPAGCTSTVGYSSVNGLPCAGVSYPAGCSAGTAFSSTTGLSCAAVVTTLPAGCSSTAGYSSTTGAKCDGASVSTNTGPLAGGAGDISVSTTTTGTTTEVVEGQSEKVFAFKVEAIDSDVSVTNLKLTFENQGAAGSDRLTDYANQVNVYMGSTKIASVDAADFTKKSATDTECAATGATICYTKSIALSNAIVREGSSNKATFYVEVEAVSNLDSTDVVSGNNDWNVAVLDFRFQDATGVIMTSSETENGNFDFTDLAGSGDVKLTISKATTSPAEGNVQASSTGVTSDVPMLAFKLKAAGSDMSFDTLTVVLAAVGVPNSTAGTEMIFDELVLKNGSTELATVDAADSATAATFDLGDMFTIDQDATETFTVDARIKEICTTATCTTTPANYFTQGDSLTVSLAQAGIDVEDSNGDTGVTESGAATGLAQTFASEGINASNFTSGTPVVTDNNGTTVDASFAISFKVTAIGNPYYVLKTGALVGKDLDPNTEGDQLPSFSPLSASSATSDGNYWYIEEGDTATFTTTGVIAAAQAPTGFSKITLSTLAFDSNGAVAAGEATYTFAPSSSFETTSVNFN